MNAIGQPISRVDGRLKVTGGARYTADIPVAGARTPPSSTARSRTAELSRSTPRRRKSPGRVGGFHASQHAAHEPHQPWSHLHPHGQGYLPLQDERIHYAGQPIALVVAATLDQATMPARSSTSSMKHIRQRYLTCERWRRTPSTLRSSCGRSHHRSVMPKGNRGRCCQD